MTSPSESRDAAYRYEISALIGPCSQEEAEQMLDRLVEREGDALGACWSIQRVGEEEGYRFDD